jgi:hypothetical protein
MALHPHVGDFYTEWLAKADNYQDESLSDYFNKAFSLFTLYNKLYAEATFTLARANEITINEQRGFPDRKGATHYAPKFLGHNNLLNLFNDDQDCQQSILELIEHIENERFFIKLSMPYGERQPEKDRQLVQDMRSTGAIKKVEAVLGLIYSVRCNMFHGNKQFDQVQIALLKPVTIILRKVIVQLYEKLSR